MDIKDPIIRDIVFNQNQGAVAVQKVNYPPYDKSKDYKNRYYSLTGGMETVRILPPLEGKALKKVFMHPYMVEGKHLKLHCLKLNDGDYCPFCEWSDKLLVLGKQKKESIMASLGSDVTGVAKQKVLEPVSEIINLSNVYKAKPFYVVELIKRAINQYGQAIPGSLAGKKTFWNFGEHYQQNGPLEMLIRLGKQFGDLSHALYGRDLTLVSTSNGNYTDLVNIIVNDPSPLFSSDQEYNLLNRDNFTWRDIFKPKTLGNISAVDYLLAIRDNKMPYWDAERRNWMIPGNEKQFNTNTKDFAHAVSMSNSNIDDVL